MKNGDYKRRRRMRLFKKQGGRCVWCGCDMVMGPDGRHVKHQPPNLATIDHLRDRFDPTRSEPNPRGEARWVLACRDCNNKRGAESEAQRPLAELHARSRRGWGGWSEGGASP